MHKCKYPAKTTDKFVNSRLNLHIGGEEHHIESYDNDITDKLNDQFK